MKKSNKKYKSPIDIATLVGIALGLGATSGLITAAALSGLIQASCPALAETYARAKLYFAVAALIALLAAGAFIVSRYAQGMRAYWFCIRIGIGFVFLLQLRVILQVAFSRVSTI
jgi:hypothetical protein